MSKESRTGGAYSRVFPTPLLWHWASFLLLCLAGTALSNTLQVDLAPAGLSNPRWKDVADNVYAASYCAAFSYADSAATLTYESAGSTFTGRLVADGLKPNFAYQLKFAASHDSPGMESLGYLGRWYWDGGPLNVTDAMYEANKSNPAISSFLLFDYVVTDANGHLDQALSLDSTYHVLWRYGLSGASGVMLPGPSDGPPLATLVDPVPTPGGAYDVNFGATLVNVFGEHEATGGNARPLPGALQMPLGDYELQFLLTEESFHGSGPLDGWWGTALASPWDQPIRFTIGAAPPDATELSPPSGAPGSLAVLRGQDLGTGAGSVRYTPDGGAETDWEVLAWTDTQITFRVPAGTASGAGAVKAIRPDGAESPPLAFWVIDAPVADIVVDNRDPNTLRIGRWSNTSTKPRWGRDSLYSRDAASRFRWIPNVQAEGYYQVYAWWPSSKSYTTQAPYRVTHAEGTALVTANQRTGAGQWNLLGVYPFFAEDSGFVELSGENGRASADAVRLVFDHPLPPRPPTLTSPLAASAVVGKPFAYTLTARGTQPITFDASGLPPGLAFDGVRTVSGVAQIAGFGPNLVPLRATNALGSDEQTLTLTVAVADLIVDNRDPNTLRIGRWGTAGNKPPWGRDSYYSKSATSRFRWIPALPAPGTYQVYAWWTASSKRSASVPYRIAHAGGEDTVPVNQRASGGVWNLLGQFPFPAGTQPPAGSQPAGGSVQNSSFIEVSGVNGQACADAVRLVYLGPLDGTSLLPATLGGPSILVAPEAGPAPLAIEAAALGVPPGATAQWTFGDGTQGTGELVSHTYLSAGTYTIRLTVGGTVRIATVTVTDPAP